MSIPSSATHLCAAALVLTMMLGSQTMQAATTLDWSPTAATTTWATSSNWIGGVAPTSDLSTHIARFNQTGYTSQPNYGTTSINGLIFGDGSTATAATTLSGTTLSLGNGGITVNANAGAVTLDGGIALGANQTLTNHSASTLTVNAGITGNNLTAGTGTVTFTGGQLHQHQPRHQWRRRCEHQRHLSDLVSRSESHHGIQLERQLAHDQRRCHSIDISHPHCGRCLQQQHRDGHRCRHDLGDRLQLRFF